MMKNLKKCVMMAMCAVTVLLLNVSCSSNTVNGDDVYELFWKAQYMEYNIKENNLGITPEKLEQDVTQSFSSFNEALNIGGEATEASLKAAVSSCAEKWKEKGWYSYIKNITFKIGIFDTMSQRLMEKYTWSCGTDYDS